MGEGLNHRSRLLQRVCCPKCDVDLAAGLLDTQHPVQLGVGTGDLSVPPPPPPDPHAYMITFHWVKREVDRPVVEFPGWASIKTSLQFHFMHHHVRDTVMVPEEGNLPEQKLP